MFEYDVPTNEHISLPKGSTPDELFLLTIGILGDEAARLIDSSDETEGGHSNGAEYADINDFEALRFSANFLDAYLDSQLDLSLRIDVILLAAATFYLAGRPGSSQVLANKALEEITEDSLVEILRWLVVGDWSHYFTALDGHYGSDLGVLSTAIAFHFSDGSGLDDIRNICKRIRTSAYREGTARELLLVDAISAVSLTRIKNSSWQSLPRYSSLDVDIWRETLTKSSFMKELWPAQHLLGINKVFSGSSAIVRMPTSAGKTRAVEIIIRSAFLSKRASFALVIAPFRALCQEITTAYRAAFAGENVQINEFSDVLQKDYLSDLLELLDFKVLVTPQIAVVTPEKLLYMLRQTPSLVDRIDLVIYDEGHQFDSGARGVTYELLITSIKRYLGTDSQTILISAVIQNTQAVANWLLGDGALVVEGADLSPTERAVAFTSWQDELGRLWFFEQDNPEQFDYFVPRVIEQLDLNLKGRESKKRVFPNRGKSTEIALYLGLKLVGNGGVAIFCGRKDTASKLSEYVVELFDRGLSLDAPRKYSDEGELAKLEHLLTRHFGSDALITKAARFGVFAHHGNTPHGVRLAVEYAMKEGLIKFVVCTSTLAQGVNLPIRYLIVSGIYQGIEQIKVRDFHNLMGRAGRAGMHTEGTVLFSDPEIYDNRHIVRGNWKWEAVDALLRAENAEPTSSSLLSIVDPLFTDNREYSLPEPPLNLIQSLLVDRTAVFAWAKEQAQLYLVAGATERGLVQQLRAKSSLIEAIENYLMANRGDESSETFLSNVDSLVKDTLANSIASTERKELLQEAFKLIAAHVEAVEPSQEAQAVFGKLLLGLDKSIKIRAWVNEHVLEFLLDVKDIQELLQTVWPLLTECVESELFRRCEPPGVMLEITKGWMAGRPYYELLSIANEAGAVRPYGQKTRKLDLDDIIDFCENGLGYDCTLILSAVAEFLSDEKLAISEEIRELLGLLQKSLRYGLPDLLSVKLHERGFSDRMLALDLRLIVEAIGGAELPIRAVLTMGGEGIQALLQKYPRYFEAVRSAIVAA